MKSILRELVPPVLWRCASRVRNRKPRSAPSAAQNGKFEYGVEQPPEFYDETFASAEHWKLHYTESHYYPLWAVVVDRLRKAGVTRLIDIGCGPGQVASLLRDAGFANYLGIDFSELRIGQARKVCPELRFEVADVFRDRRLEDEPYDCAIVMEFLEHVDRDLDVLDRIRPGSMVLATVPNFPSAGHVRHFADCEEVRRRYESHFSDLDVSQILANRRGVTYFILQGTRKSAESAA
ncbi:MAG: methyltransferase domain-containing protein [Planctomyces sp.]|nr:methyltransferase domain-containing protein [Planctomyces sp.]